MREYTDVDGAPFTEEDIERWGAEMESERGYMGGHLGPAEPGSPRTRTKNAAAPGEVRRRPS